jgi:hypothetical protein
MIDRNDNLLTGIIDKGVQLNRDMIDKDESHEK